VYASEQTEQAPGEESQAVSVGVFVDEGMTLGMAEYPSGNWIGAAFCFDLDVGLPFVPVSIGVSGGCFFGLGMMDAVILDLAIRLAYHFGFLGPAFDVYAGISVGYSAGFTLEAADGTLNDGGDENTRIGAFFGLRWLFIKKTSGLYVEAGYTGGFPVSVWFPAGDLKYHSFLSIGFTQKTY
jgi:hypothetical protein